MDFFLSELAGGAKGDESMMASYSTLGKAFQAKLEEEEARQRREIVEQQTKPPDPTSRLTDENQELKRQLDLARSRIRDLESKFPTVSTVSSIALEDDLRLTSASRPTSASPRGAPQSPQSPPVTLVAVRRLEDELRKRDAAIELLTREVASLKDALAKRGTEDQAPHRLSRTKTQDTLRKQLLSNFPLATTAPEPPSPSTESSSSSSGGSTTARRHMPKKVASYVTAESTPRTRSSSPGPLMAVPVPSGSPSPLLLGPELGVPRSRSPPASPSSQLDWKATRRMSLNLGSPGVLADLPPLQRKPLVGPIASQLTSSRK